jgi:hypothetical protein
MFWILLWIWFFFFLFCTSIQYPFIFKVWHDITCWFWRRHIVLLMLCFLILFLWIFFSISSFYSLIHGVWQSLFFLVLFILCRVVDFFFFFFCSLKYNNSALALFFFQLQKNWSGPQRSLGHQSSNG